MFGPRVARRSLDRYRRRGLDRLERKLLGTVAPGDVAGASVLEIGGGIGALQAELLRSGASRGEVVELVDAYEPYARELAQEQGFSDRSRFRVLDVLENPDAVEPAAIVILNRVVCCSPDGLALTEFAGRLAQRALLLTFPRDRLLVRLGLRLVNAWERLSRRSFRVFLHPPPAIIGAAEGQGLRLATHERGRLWEVATLERRP
jgi:magnesium-protoporphyrin O-methyltransferase